MPQVSRSPKRKRVRRYFSASAATGARWNPKLQSASRTSSTVRSRRRGSNASSDEPFEHSPTHTHHDLHSDDDNTFGFSEIAHAFPPSEHHAHSPPLRQPLAYASLPPTPLSPSPPQTPSLSAPLPSFPSLDSFYEPPFSIWDYLREELLATDFDSHQELKWERVSNFLSMPIALEKVSCLVLTRRCQTLTQIMICRSFSLVSSSAWIPSCIPSLSCPYDSHSHSGVSS